MSRPETTTVLWARLFNAITRAIPTDRFVSLSEREAITAAVWDEMQPEIRRLDQRAEQAEADLARSKDVAIREAEQVRSERNRYAERAEQAEAEVERLKAERAGWRSMAGVAEVEAERDRLREELRLARFDKERAEATVARLRVLRDDYWRLPGCSEIGDDLDVALSPEEN